jgi:hypothetical protein
MSDEQADAIYGRLCREIARLGREIALLESEFKRVGQRLETAGKCIQNQSFAAVNRDAIETDLNSVWDMREKYEQAVVDHSQKKAEKEAIDGKS